MMRHFLIGVLLAITSVGPSAASFAQEVNTTDLALQVTEAVISFEQSSKLIAGLITSAAFASVDIEKFNAQSSDANLAVVIESSMRSYLEKSIFERAVTTKGEIATLFREQLSEDEMQTVLKFYLSPAGKKLANIYIMEAASATGQLRDLVGDTELAKAFNGDSSASAKAESIVSAELNKKIEKSTAERLLKHNPEELKDFFAFYTSPVYNKISSLQGSAIIVMINSMKKPPSILNKEAMGAEVVKAVLIYTLSKYSKK